MAVGCNLILPSSFVEKRNSDKEILKKKFKKELDDFIDAHQSISAPYFILIKDYPDKQHANLNRQALTFYKKRPPFITRTMVFWVDNSRGLVTWLWRVTPEKEMIFNKAFAKSCPDILRVEASPA